MPAPLRILAAITVIAAVLAFGSSVPAAGVGSMAIADSEVATKPPRHGTPEIPESLAGWSWPMRPFRLVAPFVAPAHAYGPGHRGIDMDGADSGVTEVLAPAAGMVAFAGSVAGRGVVTIDHGSGLVSTLEPVTPGVRVGDVVRQGEHVADLAVGGHAAPGTLHLGVRVDGAYINPLRILGGVPRAILLPCC